MPWMLPKDDFTHNSGLDWLLVILYTFIKIYHCVQFKLITSRQDLPEESGADRTSNGLFA